MKTKSIFFIVVVAVFCSCKDFLEPTPRATTTTVSYYRNASEAEAALNGVYAPLMVLNAFGQNITEFILLGCTDEANGNFAYTDVNRSPWGNGSYDANNTLLPTAWAQLFTGISRANYLLENLNNVSNFTGNRKLEIEAEARLMRGVIYMYLAQMWGGVPVYTTGFQDPLKARQPLNEVYTQIIEDYTFAYENLPHRNQIKGRVSKWSAGGLLCRVYTYLAAAKTYGMPDFGLELNSVNWVNAQDYYTKAKTISEDVINNSGYELISDYSRLFRESTKDDQYQECLFLIEAAKHASDLTSASLVNCLAPQGNRDVDGGGSAQFRPTGELFYKYNVADKRSHHNLRLRIAASNPLSEMVDGTRYFVPNPLEPSGPLHGNFTMAKFRQVDPQVKYAVGMLSWQSFISFPLLRFADIILLHAEACYFLGDETTARADLSKVRARAVVESKNEDGEDEYTVEHLNTAYYKSDFIEELLDERTRELCFEGIRKFDLKRFNVYTKTIENLNTNYTTYATFNQIVTLLQENWKPEKIWLPVPQTQRDLNLNLEQNPGY